MKNDSPLAKMSFDEQIDYWHGRFILAIGKGETRTIVNYMINYYNQEAFARGFAEGKKAVKETQRRKK